MCGGVAVCAPSRGFPPSFCSEPPQGAQKLFAPSRRFLIHLGLIAPTDLTIRGAPKHVLITPTVHSAAAYFGFEAAKPRVNLGRKDFSAGDAAVIFCSCSSSSIFMTIMETPEPTATAMPTRDPREMMESEAYTAVGLAILHVKGLASGRGG
uniref:Uncharacterized protein n=1 Tax=Mantoniella antarctica TaxID=81844 RepID=A0A7S0X5Y1_9CHLO|eukprot:CAMPEP_0181359994 /NCGR_PEP_ID=MMETSP1106-20121128/6410_1 /TAXON_ID=81844 /ORGANISM="Mantoniella antarctica, Strain SL-175" /LENGTH=151 /DNA_ID=CAMNT_0023473199 /DNA_START=320 /DNA_END=775 /DNA_ORIENTATION=+